MKHITIFENQSEYNAEIEAGAPNLFMPNMSYIEDEDIITWIGERPSPKADSKVGDILYWNGTKLKTIPFANWALDLGTPVAVCVIPTSHDVYGTGEAGWIAVHGVNTDGSHAISGQTMVWNNNVAVLSQYTKVPTWANDGTISSTDSISGYLPTIWATENNPCNGDVEARYKATVNMIPSPYINGERRADYYRTISGGNALSDFNGKENTQKMILGGNSTAAIACNLYSDSGVPGTSWYLPAMGELGYFANRMAVIESAFNVLGFARPSYCARLWSSTEATANTAWALGISMSNVLSDNKTGTVCCVYPFMRYAA